MENLLYIKWKLAFNMEKKEVENRWESGKKIEKCVKAAKNRLKIATKCRKMGKNWLKILKKKFSKINKSCAKKNDYKA